jgi:hypothetical protein
MDLECVKLCTAMNRLPGIETFESCCGHGDRPFKVWFFAESLEVLPALLYWFDACHSGVQGWRVYVTTDCAMSPAKFEAEGPIGDYEGATKIAEALSSDAATENEKRT